MSNSQIVSGHDTTINKHSL